MTYPKDTVGRVSRPGRTALESHPTGGAFPSAARLRATPPVTLANVAAGREPAPGHEPVATLFAADPSDQTKRI